MIARCDHRVALVVFRTFPAWRTGFHGSGGCHLLRPPETQRGIFPVLPIEPPAAAARGSRGPSPLPRIGASFADLGVPAPIVAALADAAITDPFPIQAATLPDALSGRDILGRGQTGSGKTLAFSIPLVALLADGYTSACRPRGLVLVPTRELASQVHAVLAPLAESVGLTVATIYGGVPQ